MKRTPIIILTIFTIIFLLLLSGANYIGNQVVMGLDHTDKEYHNSFGYQLYIVTKDIMPFSSNSLILLSFTFILTIIFIAFLFKSKIGEKLLQLFYIALLLESVLKLLSMLYVSYQYFSNSPKEINTPLWENSMMLIKAHSISFLVWGLISIYILYCFKTEKSPKIFYLEDDDTTYIETASITLRIAHWVIDMVVFFIFTAKIQLAMLQLDRNSGGEVASFITVYIVYKFIYYFISECLFDASPAKILLTTRVFSSDGNRPTFGQKLVRTILRFIPFEPLTWFLFENKMGHDEWSNTLVCKEN